MVEGLGSRAVDGRDVLTGVETLSFRIDASPQPAGSELNIYVGAPNGLDLAAADDTGSSDSDNVTSQSSGLTITGQAESNALVELFDGSTSLGTTDADASGAFSLDVTLAAGARCYNFQPPDCLIQTASVPILKVTLIQTVVAS